jgi:hypothetical protein
MLVRTSIQSDARARELRDRLLVVYLSPKRVYTVVSTCETHPVYQNVSEI